MLGAVLGLARARGAIGAECRLVAVDSTGFEPHHVSYYYGKRCGRRMRHYPKLSAVCDTASHLLLAAVVDHGPKPDHIEFEQAVTEAHRLVPFRHLLADAGYDSEHHHRLVRLGLGAETTIPATTGRPTDRLPTGRFRRQMRTNFDKVLYGQRWQIESAFSRCKRRLGSSLTALSPRTQLADIQIRVLTYNLMITLAPHLFSTEQLLSLFSASGR